jgi:hypothetical protein
LTNALDLDQSRKLKCEHTQTEGAFTGHGQGAMLIASLSGVVSMKVLRKIGQDPSPKKLHVYISFNISLSEF